MHPAAASKYRRRHLVDVDPIVFPTPGSATRPESAPPDFDTSGDLIIDPYGNIYCFVCQVSVPKGASNLSQHLEGKKHDTNNKRFSSHRQKQAVRARYIAAAAEQRNNLPDLPTEVPVSLPVPGIPVAEATPIASASTQNPSTSADPNTHPNGQSLPVSPKDRTKKAKRMELSQKYKDTTIDKGAFLKSLLSDDDGGVEMDHSSDSAADTHPGDEDAPHRSSSPSIDLEERTRPFAPLNFKPPPFPVSFDEATAEESTPTETAATIRELLSCAPSVKATAPDHEQSEDNTRDSVASSDTQPGSSAEGPEKIGEFIRIGGKATDGSEKEEEAEADKMKRIPREAMLVLKDRTGEELPPWLLDGDATQNVLYSADSSIALHYEILQFSRFVSATDKESRSRKEMVLTVETIVKQLWPNSVAELFGSYATGLDLPTSDIDLCIMGTPDGGELKEFEQLASAIRNVKGFARRVHVIKAKVPLVKIISRKNSVNCDICIGRDNGPRNVPVIREFLSTYPALRPLVLVVKCFLKQRDLNETFSGGLGSYTILLLVVSHLQMLKYNFPTSKTNLGAVLQTFFQFYGRMFNMCIAGIRVKEGGCYFDKFEKYQTTPADTMRFSVEDPNDETNELGRNGFASTRVRKAFNNASVTLINWRRDDSAGAPTPLGAVVQYDDFMRVRRKSVVEDMEKKGLQPVRECITEMSRGVKRSVREMRGANLAEEHGGRAPSATAGTPYNSSNRNDRDPRGRDPRDRDRRYRDASERQARGRNLSDRDPRERDPRLAKRRRSSHGQEGETLSADAGTATHNDPRSNRSHVVNRVNNSRSGQHYGGQEGQQNSGRGMYDGVSDPNAYGGPVYQNQPNFPDYPVQQYPVSTPGYQYVDQRAATANNMAAAPMYGAPRYMHMSHPGAHSVPPSYGQQQLSGSSRRGRGVKKRGGYRGRGSYRGR